MSATTPFHPAMQRAVGAVLALARTLLMGAGLLSLIVLLTLSLSDGRAALAKLGSWLPGNPVVAVVEAAESGWDEPALAASEEEATDALSPRMRGALDYVSRRYRVSGDALEPIFATAETSGREQRVDPLLIVAIIAVESRFNPFSESIVGAQGLMQVVPRYHQDKLPDGAAEHSFLDPLLNVRIGTRILKESIMRGGSLSAGLQQFGGAPDDAEQRYAMRVLAEKARMEAAAQRRPQA